MQERNDLRLAAGLDVAGKCREGGGPRAAGVDDGRDARVDAAQVGVEAVPGDAVQDVRVQVDQAGGDDPAREFDGPRGLDSGDVGGDPRDEPVLHRDVMRAGETR